MEILMLITGKVFRRMMISAANNLDNNKEETNKLNVFPVPDGDTGTNMSLTLSTLTSSVEYESVGEAAKNIADIMLRAARGNSGAILSLFFRGVAKALCGIDKADTSHFVSALESGTKEAYRAVMNPTEGTVLTVMRECSACARAAYSEYNGISIGEILDKVVDSAKMTLEKTPEMLESLKQAGVVDAGGYGFVLVLDGMRRAYLGHGVEALNAVQKEFDTVKTSGADFAAVGIESIKFLYCTECIIEKNEQYLGKNLSGELLEFLKGIGDSAVFVDDERIIKLHIHTNDPGAVLSRAISFGSLASVKVENMLSQHSDLVKEEREKRAESDKRYGFVSVCMGKGIADAFYDLGVDNIIEGGQTMNPSTQEIIDAIMKPSSENVFIFPNNKNVAMVAVQASELVEDRSVFVIPTESVPQGIAALMAFDSEGDVEYNKRKMQNALRLVRSMAITHAVRDTKTDGFSIKQGQLLGLVENKIVCVANSIDECICRLAERMTGASFVTVFYGDGVSALEAEGAVDIIAAKVGGACEIVLLKGDQPIYDYIISVEN